MIHNRRARQDDKNHLYLFFSAISAISAVNTFFYDSKPDANKEIYSLKSRILVQLARERLKIK